MYDFFPQPETLGSAVLYVNDALAITPSTTLLRRKDNCRRVFLLHFPGNPTLAYKEKRYTEKWVRSEGRKGRRQRKKYPNCWEHLSFPGSCRGILSRPKGSLAIQDITTHEPRRLLLNMIRNTEYCFFFSFYHSEWCSKPLDYFLICPFPPHFISFSFAVMLRFI